MSQLHNECNSASKNENFWYPEVSNEVIEGSRHILKVSRSLEPGHNTNYVTLTLPKSRMDKSLVDLAAFFLCCPGSALDFLIL